MKFQYFISFLINIFIVTRRCIFIFYEYRGNCGSKVVCLIKKLWFNKKKWFNSSRSPLNYRFDTHTTLEWIPPGLLTKDQRWIHKRLSELHSTLCSPFIATCPLRFSFSLSKHGADTNKQTRTKQSVVDEF